MNNSFLDFEKPIADIHDKIQALREIVNESPELLPQIAKLEEEEKIYKNDITNIGNVIDYDYANSITECKKCFTDPIHTNDSINLIIVKEIFRDSLVLGKKL